MTGIAPAEDGLLSGDSELGVPLRHETDRGARPHRPHVAGPGRLALSQVLRNVLFGALTFLLASVPLCCRLPIREAASLWI